MPVAVFDTPGHILFLSWTIPLCLSLHLSDISLMKPALLWKVMDTQWNVEHEVTTAGEAFFVYLA